MTTKEERDELRSWLGNQHNDWREIGLRLLDERDEQEKEIDRRMAERHALLGVCVTTDGLTASEWLARTAKAEAECARLKEVLRDERKSAKEREDRLRDSLADCIFVAQEAMLDAGNARYAVEARLEGFRSALAPPNPEGTMAECPDCGTEHVPPRCSEPTEASQPERIVACVQCGKPVEHVREVYATPMCYACLPPPKIRKVENLADLSKEGGAE